MKLLVNDRSVIEPAILDTMRQAAEICLRCGCTMIIANGDNADALYDILDGKPVGTKFHAR